MRKWSIDYCDARGQFDMVVGEQAVWRERQGVMTNSEITSEELTAQVIASRSDLCFLSRQPSSSTLSRLKPHSHTCSCAEKKRVE